MATVDKKMNSVQILEVLKQSMNESEVRILADTFNALFEGATRVQARRRMCHAMFDMYNRIAYEHEVVKDAIRILCKRFMNGSRSTDAEDIAFFDFLGWITEGAYMTK